MPVDPPSFGGLLLQLVVSLALVCGLAYLIIRFGLARWLGHKNEQSSVLEVLETLPLGGRRTIYLVRSMDRLLIVGATDQHLTTLCDLGAGSVDSYQETAFAEALQDAAAEAANSAATADGSELPP